jgi:hypothetical protein
MTEKLHSIVRFDDKGNVVCFCSYDEYLVGKCKCRDKFDCPEAMISIDVIPNSKPSEKVVSAAKNIASKAKRANQKAKKSFDSIKKGVSQLEKAVKNTRFKI